MAGDFVVVPSLFLVAGDFVVVPSLTFVASEAQLEVRDLPGAPLVMNGWTSRQCSSILGLTFVKC